MFDRQHGTEREGEACAARGTLGLGNTWIPTLTSPTPGNIYRYTSAPPGVALLFLFFMKSAVPTLLMCSPHRLFYFLIAIVLCEDSFFFF